MSQTEPFTDTTSEKPFQISSSQHKHPSAKAKDSVLLRSPLAHVDPHLVSLTAPNSEEAEEYRSLRYAVECVHKPGNGLVIGVCSPLAGEGKSLTAINLAGALGQNSKSRVLLIEADMRKPSLTIMDHLALGNVAGRGLVDAIQHKSLTLNDIVQYLPHFNFSILPAGRQSTTPYEAIKSARFSQLLDQTRQFFDYVIVDTPPIIPVPDSRLLEAHVDAFIMVVGAHSTPRDAVREALTLMGSASFLGLVFNNYKRPVRRNSSGRGYGHSTTQTGVRWWNRLWRN